MEPALFAPTVFDFGQRLEEILRLRKAFLESDCDIEREKLSYLGIRETSHLFRELTAWATEYRVGLMKLWWKGISIEDPQQVIEAATASQIDSPSVARNFLADFFDIFGIGAGSIFTQLSQDLASLEWGQTSPMLTPVQTKQPEHMRQEWSFRIMALMPLEYLNGVNGHGSREDNIHEVETAFGLAADTLIDWTKKSKHPTQIFRPNLVHHLERARAIGLGVKEERLSNPDASSDFYGGETLLIDGRNYQSWQKSLPPRHRRATAED